MIGAGDFLVADHVLEVFQGGEMGGAHRVELAEVGEQHALLGLAQDLLLDLDFIEVEARHTELLTDARRRHEGPRQAHAVENAAFGAAFKHLVLAVKGAAAQDDVAVGFVVQLKQHVQRTAHGSELQLVGDEVNDEGRGGAAVEEDCVTGLYQTGSELADAAFLLDVTRALVGDPVFADLAAAPGDVAAKKTQVIAEVIEIAAQGHLGNVQQRSHFPQVNGVLVLQGLLDKLESLGFSTVHEYSRA